MSRALGITLWLIYTCSVALCGLLPHNHEDGLSSPNYNCSACIWHSVNVTDAPQLTSAPVTVNWVILPLVPFDTLFVAADFDPATPVRAPPVVHG